MSREAWIVVDLGFGDAGKGSITDFLVRDRGASLVVRFNGGAQAGHNVVEPDGRHHTFSQFGSGTFAGAHTLLGPRFVLHPLGMWMEAQHLVEVGIADPWAKTEVDRRALVISPYQQAAGRARERVRGAAAHGTCGVGVGEAVGDQLQSPDDALCAGDLVDATAMREKLSRQRDRKRSELEGLGAMDTETRDLFDDDGLIARVLPMWLDVGALLRLRTASQVQTRVRDVPRVVFEGAQGVLIDESWGFHPHTTWSDCTFAGAEQLAGDRPVHRLGVLRAYGVRHGPGPFPTEASDGLREPHNDDAGWQGRFRTGALDGVLLRYALEVCGGVDGLALTCLDRVGTRAQACNDYVADGGDGLVRRRDNRVMELIPGQRDDLAHRERLGAWLRDVRAPAEAADAVEFVQRSTGAEVWLESRGPTWREKAWRGGAAGPPDRRRR